MSSSNTDMSLNKEDIEHDTLSNCLIVLSLVNYSEDN